METPATPDIRGPAPTKKRAFLHFLKINISFMVLRCDIFPDFACFYAKNVSQYFKVRRDFFSWPRTVNIVIQMNFFPSQKGGPKKWQHIMKHNFFPGSPLGLPVEPGTVHMYTRVHASAFLPSRPWK